MRSAGRTLHEASLVGTSGLRFRLTGSRYEFADDRYGSDADWVEGVVSLARPGVDPVAVEVTWRTEEVAAFAEELRSLSRGSASSAELVHLEEMFGVTVRVRDAVEMTGFVGLNREVEFHDGSDHDALRAAASEFEALSAAFPVRSSPSGDLREVGREALSALRRRIGDVWSRLARRR